MHKLDALTRILEVETFDAMLVFARTKQATVELVEKLEARGFASAALNGIWRGLHSAGATLTVALYVYAKEQGEFGVAFAIAAILMVLALLINLAASLVSRYFRRKNAL